MLLRDFHAEEASSTADVAEGLEPREVEFRGEGLEVDAGETGHGIEEDLELRRVRVELLEDVSLAVLDFVLGLAGAESFRKVVPEFEQADIEHVQNAADVARTVLV